MRESSFWRFIIARYTAPPLPKRHQKLKTTWKLILTGNRRTSQCSFSRPRSLSSAKLFPWRESLAPRPSARPVISSSITRERCLTGRDRVTALSHLVITRIVGTVVLSNVFRFQNMFRCGFVNSLHHLLNYWIKGINPKNGKPYTNRLYSIASTRYGDDMKVNFHLYFVCVRNRVWRIPDNNHYLYFRAKPPRFASAVPLIGTMRWRPMIQQRRACALTSFATLSQETKWCSLVPPARSCSCQRRTQRPTLSWLPPEPESHHTGN